MRWTDPDEHRTKIVTEAGELVREYCNECGQVTDPGEAHLCEGWKPLPPMKRSEPMSNDMTAAELVCALRKMEDAGVIKPRRKATSGIVLTTYGRELLKRAER